MKQKYRSNPYKDDGVKMILSISRYMPCTGTEKYHKISKAYHKVIEVKKFRSKPYKDDIAETILCAIIYHDCNQYRD